MLKNNEGHNKYKLIKRIQTKLVTEFNLICDRKKFSEKLPIYLLMESLGETINFKS